MTTAEPEQQESGTCRPPGRSHFNPTGSDLSDLGPTPRRYDVRLTLDGQTYAATATVPPRARDFDGHPTTYLTFDPPLPAFTG